MYDPIKPFHEVSEQLQSTTYSRIMGMTEDQVRYALWGLLVNVVGHPSSNAFEIVRASQATTLESTEATLILQQLMFKPGSPILHATEARLRNFLNGGKSPE